jgi:hypothetical protein
MGSGGPAFTGEILDELVHQFADPVSCFRELIQNSIDAGTAEIEIRFNFECDVEDSPSSSDEGAIVIEVQDFGSGMDKEIIDEKLTRLFSSEKEGDATKIGKFGIGFVSIFALEPEAVVIDTGRAGERWRIVFDEKRSFRRFALEEAIEGTRVRLIKSGTRADFEDLRERARTAVRYWCGHVDVELRFDDEVIAEDFNIEGRYVREGQSGMQRYVIGHAAQGTQLHGFYNSGITLEAKPEIVNAFSGLSFKVFGGDLEHTLTRDGVVRNEAYARAIDGLRKLVDGPVREAFFADLAKHIAEGKRGRELVSLYAASLIHLRRMWQRDDLPPPETVARQAFLPRAGGEWLSIGSLWTLSRKEPLRFARSASPAARILDRESPVLVTGESEDIQRLLHELSRHGDPIDVDAEVAIPDFDSEVAQSLEARRLCAALESILAATGANVRAVSVGHFRWPGSQIKRLIAVSLRQRERPPKLDELGRLGHGLFSRERELVLNADHSLVKEALIASQREPEIAAYLIIKAFRLSFEDLSYKHDNARISAAWELRCRRLGN